MKGMDRGGYWKSAKEELLTLEKKDEWEVIEG